MGFKKYAQDEAYVEDKNTTNKEQGLEPRTKNSTDK